MSRDIKLELYRAHRHALLDYATRLAGDRAQGEDLVQEAFLRLPEAPSGEIANPIAYLYRTIRNLAWDQARRLRGERRHAAEAPLWLPAEAPTDPERESIHRQHVGQVAEALAALPERARLALEMKRLGGFTLEEIARRLDVSVPTAHRLVKQAMLQVAAALGDEVP